MILFDCKLKKVFIRQELDGHRIFLMTINNKNQFNYSVIDKK
jgi:hypothetical protein